MLTALFDSIHDSVMVTDPDGIITLWNAGATRIYGWTAAERIGTPLWSRVPPEARPALRAAFEAIRAGQHFDGEWPDYHKDGHRIWVHARVRAFTDAEGKLAGVIGVAHDVTEQRRTNERLAAREAQLRIAVGEEQPVSYWELDLARDELELAESLREWLELDPGAISQARFIDAFVSADRKLLAAKLAKAASGRRTKPRLLESMSGRTLRVAFEGSGGVRPDHAERILGVAIDVTATEQASMMLEDLFEHAPIGLSLLSPSCEILRRNSAALELAPLDGARINLLQTEGEYTEERRMTRRGLRTIREALFPVRNRHHEVSAYVHMQIDTTREAEARAALARSEARHRMLAEHASDLIARCDLDGTIRFASAAAFTLLGVEPETLVGSSWWALVEDADRDELRRRWAACVSGSADVVQYRMRHASGQPAIVESTLSAVRTTPDEQPREIIVVTRDVGARVRLEEEREQTLKLDAVARLSAGVAHDFNNLLTVITAGLDLLGARLQSEDPGVRETIDEIALAADRASALTRRLVTIGRADPGRGGITDLTMVIEDLARLLRSVAGANTTVVLQTPQTGVRVPLVRAAVEQILVNLVSNAADSMSSGGRLTITVETPDVERGEVALMVADTGTGMDANTRERLFEPFFTTKPSGRGTGLGLAVVRGLVEQAGGRIEVDSELGQGTRMRVVLPCADRLDAPGAQPANAGTVLLVEDDNAVRNTAERALRAGGYSVIATRDGSEAVRVAADLGAAIDVLVCDVVMPGLQGPEVVATVRRLHPEIAVLMMSGYHQDRAVSEHAFVAKPFTVAELLAGVVEARDRVGAGTPGRTSDLRH